MRAAAAGLELCLSGPLPSRYLLCRERNKGDYQLGACDRIESHLLPC
jgi:hypothetical protein